MFGKPMYILSNYPVTEYGVGRQLGYFAEGVRERLNNIDHYVFCLIEERKER